MPRKRNNEPAPDSTHFRLRLEECAQKAGTPNALAAKADIPASTLAGYRKQGREPPRDELIAIAAAVGYAVGWLVDGKGPKEAALVAQTPSSTTPINVASPSAVPTFDSTCFIVDLLPKLNERYPHDGYRSFEITDDRMEPALMPGDITIVREQSEFRMSGIYLIQGVKFDFIARAEVSHDGSLKLTYDNPAYRLSQVAFDKSIMKCLGRVVSRLTPLEQKVA